MLLILGSVKVLVSKDNKWKHRGVRVKCTIVTVIKCISANSRYLNLMIIWLASTY
jgi:hypothetical protein